MLFCYRCRCFAIRCLRLHLLFLFNNHLHLLLPPPNFLSALHCWHWRFLDVCLFESVCVCVCWPLLLMSLWFVGWSVGCSLGCCRRCWIGLLLWVLTIYFSLPFSVCAHEVILALFLCLVWCMRFDVLLSVPSPLFHLHLCC